MSIKAVFRVQCDGPCKGWLSRTEDYVLGTEALSEHNEVLPTAERAWLWPGERAARTAAIDAGWRFSHDRTKAPYKIYCPKCSPDPYGAARYFPQDRGQVADLIRAQSGSLPLSTPCACGHVLNWHTGVGLCTAGMNTTVGCDCLGFKVQEGWGDQSQPCQTCTHIHQGRVLCGHIMTGYHPCICMNEVTQKCRATTPSGDFRCTRPQGHDDEHRNGTLDWF